MSTTFEMVMINVTGWHTGGCQLSLTHHVRAADYDLDGAAEKICSIARATLEDRYPGLKKVAVQTTRYMLPLNRHPVRKDKS